MGDVYECRRFINYGYVCVMLLLICFLLNFLCDMCMWYWFIEVIFKYWVVFMLEKKEMMLKKVISEIKGLKDWIWLNLYMVVYIDLFCEFNM